MLIVTSLETLITFLFSPVPKLFIHKLVVLDWLCAECRKMKYGLEDYGSLCFSLSPDLHLSVLSQVEWLLEQESGRVRETMMWKWP
jgi:hypothetical protein